MAHYISYNLLDTFIPVDNRGNSMANTCINGLYSVKLVVIR